MRIVESWEDIPQITPPIALALGNFDGVHQGHLYLIDELKKKGTPVVITFRNHPAEILSPKNIPTSLFSLEEKLQALKKAGVQLLILLSFTSELASMTYEAFLRKVKHHLPFQFFVAGKGDTFGFRREGTEARVKQIAQELAFEAIYLEKLTKAGAPISSTRIRTLIADGYADEAHQLFNQRL